MKTVLIHFLAQDAAGPIRSTRRVVGQGNQTVEVSRGGRWLVACEPGRKHLSLVSKSGAVLEHFAATGDPRVVTCPKCMSSLAYQQSAGEV